MKYLRSSLLPLLLSAWAISAVASEPFDVRVFGNFGSMLHSGDTRGVIKLREILTPPGSYGVGALDGVRGEILLWDGKLLVSRGRSANGAVESATPTDEAVLFAEARVKAWDELAVPKDMARAEFESYVLQTAARRGLNTDRAFPFAIKGNFPRVLWHVVAGASSAHGDQSTEAAGVHSQGHARDRVFDQSNVAGFMLGFYSGAALEGVISHPGERFHLHYADSGFSVSGHVDDYQVARGAVLLLSRQ